jgi:hypothetical protein
VANEELNRAQRIIEKFGGQTALAGLLHKRQSTVQHWAKTGTIPAKWQSSLLELAAGRGVELRPDEFFGQMTEEAPLGDGDGDLEETDGPEADPAPEGPVPAARWPGVLQIGDGIPCYVLENGVRVISQRGAVKTIAGVDTGKAGNYWGLAALKPYLNNDLSTGETIVFSIPGVPTTAKGISAETFIDICNAYVKALKAGDLATARQREIAVNCSMFLAACARVGLLALIDEATGYQYERAEDALQVKLRAFLEEEMRAWEKTFPDELWREFGRLTNWKGTIHNRPKYWGKLVMELVYGYLDRDVADWLKENAPAPRHGQNYHQWLSSQYGLKRLVEHIWMLIGIATTCRSMRELREKMAERFGKEMVQVSLIFPQRSN